MKPASRLSRDLGLVPIRGKGFRALSSLSPCNWCISTPNQTLSSLTVQDTNGNQITSSTSGGVQAFTDSVGRKIVRSNSSGILVSIKNSSDSLTDRSYHLTSPYTSNCGSDQCMDLVFPDQGGANTSNSPRYRLVFRNFTSIKDPDGATTGFSDRELIQLYYPHTSGAHTSSGYVTYDWEVRAVGGNRGSTRLTSKRVNAQDGYGERTWTYSEPDTYTNQETRPDQTKVKYTYQFRVPGFESRREYLSSTGTVLKQVLKEWCSASAEVGLSESSGLALSTGVE